MRPRIAKALETSLLDLPTGRLFAYVSSPWTSPTAPKTST